MLNLSFKNIFKVFLVAYYFYPLFDASLSFYVVVPLKSVCQHTLPLQNQVLFQLLILNTCIVELAGGHA